MKWLGFVFLLVACSLSVQTSVVPEIQYRSVPDFLHLPTDLYFGEVAGVAVNSKATSSYSLVAIRLVVAYGAASAQLLEFSLTGNLCARLVTTSMHGLMHIR